MIRSREWVADFRFPCDRRESSLRGLFDANRITASQLAQLLVATYNDFRVSSDFLASLPISGVDGTMRRRQRDSAATRNSWADPRSKVEKLEVES
ncbi:MAG TPA: hypothetical protein ENJ18_19275 [Nannocystis exedens]|nr:hypothetical protein [Nannocystis exedens]